MPGLCLRSFLKSLETCMTVHLSYPFSSFSIMTLKRVIGILNMNLMDYNLLVCQCTSISGLYRNSWEASAFLKMWLDEIERDELLRLKMIKAKSKS